MRFEEYQTLKEVQPFRINTFKGLPIFIITKQFEQLSPTEQLNGLHIMRRTIDLMEMHVRKEIRKKS